VLGIVLATFPTVVNTVVAAGIATFGPGGVAGLAVQIANFYLVVAPGEEVAKLAAVFAFAYWHDDFDTVVDGAVYGTVAGLGFATIENVSYILRALVNTGSPLELVVVGSVVTGVRSIAGPGHVIWTGIAGYYLGLAKFNDEYWLAITVKGLLIAALLHGTYNSVTTVIGSLGFLGPARILLTLAFAAVLHLAAFAYLFLKVRGYRKAYAEASPGPDAAPVSDLQGGG
jgi:RsiW-degrading membrane proteinase PrsW (M82 family)